MMNKKENLIKVLQTERDVLKKKRQAAKEHDVTIEYLKNGTLPIDAYIHPLLDTARHEFETLCSIKLDLYGKELENKHCTREQSKKLAELGILQPTWKAGDHYSFIPTEKFAATKTSILEEGDFLPKVFYPVKLYDYEELAAMCNNNDFNSAEALANHLIKQLQEMIISPTVCNEYLQTV